MVTGGGNSYSFRVAAVASGGGESPYTDPTDFIETPNAAPTIPASPPRRRAMRPARASAHGDVVDDGGTDNLTYAWSVASSPTGGDAWFDDTTAATPTIHFTQAGDYSVTLDLNDGYGGTAEAHAVDHRRTDITSIDMSPNAAGSIGGDASSS